MNNTLEELKETKRKLEKVNALENRLLQFPGMRTWKISGFNEILKQAKSGVETVVKSAPFYDHGYKFRLSLYPNGRSFGKNTHVSILFFVMKGEYDALLSWPFRKKLTFTLVDQQEHPNDRENIVDSFIVDPIRHKESCLSPVTDGNFTGVSFSTFVSHKKVWERCYIVDNIILIQVQVEPPE